MTKHCKRSDPEINGKIEKHETWCKYRIAKKSGFQYQLFGIDSNV